MNKIKLKIFCIFLILIYCLAPLSAMDLNQDKATADNNQTIDNTDGEIKIANETIDESTIHTGDDDDLIVDKITDDSSKDIDAKTIENPNTENDVDLNLRVEIKNIEVGEKAVIIAHTNETFTGHLYFGLWDRDHMDSGFCTAGLVNVKNGYGERIIDEKIPSGNYTAEVMYVKSWRYPFDESEVFVDFTVSKINPDLNINVNDSAVDEKTIIEIHGNNKLNESVNLKLNNSKEYTIKLKDGSSTITIDDLSPGKYSATVSYDGDERFDSCEKTAQFVKTGTDDLNLRIQINDTLAETCPVAEVYADESFNSFNTSLKMSCPEFHHSYLPIVKNGYGSVKLWDEAKLAPGNYTAIITYDGDNTYRASSATTSFSVAKGDPDLRVYVDDVHNKSENAIVKVKAHKLLNGTVKVDMKSASDSKTVDVNVTDGVGEATVSNFQEGKYTVDASFNGNNRFIPGSASTSFNVVLGNPDLRMDIYTMGYGGTTASIKIYANESLNGDVKVKIQSGNNHDEATVKLVDGVGETKFGALDYGTYSATATFDGNDIIKSGSTNTTFVIRHII